MGPDLFLVFPAIGLTIVPESTTTYVSLFFEVPPETVEPEFSMIFIPISVDNITHKTSIAINDESKQYLLDS